LVPGIRRTVLVGAVAAAVILLSCRQQERSDTPLPDAAETVDSAAIDSDTPGAFPDTDASNGTVFSSDRGGEQLFHVRVLATESDPIFVFLGASSPEDSSDTLAQIRVYEYTRSSGLYVIDSFPMEAFGEKWVGNDEGVFFEQMVYRQADNLAISLDTLHYYSEHGTLKDAGEGVPEGMYARTHFRYKLLSRGVPEAIDRDTFRSHNPRRTVGPMASYHLSHDQSIAAYTNIYNIRFYQLDGDRRREFVSYWDNSEPLASPEADSSRNDFCLLQYFPGSELLEEPCDDEALFGGMDWHPSGEYLFFDNSGYCYACLWVIDLATRNVVKIVPDHEAIHPFWFQTGGQGFLAYVQGSEVRWVRIDLKSLTGRGPGEKGGTALPPKHH